MCMAASWLITWYRHIIPWPKQWLHGHLRLHYQGLVIMLHFHFHSFYDTFLFNWWHRRQDKIARCRESSCRVAMTGESPSPPYGQWVKWRLVVADLSTELRSCMIPVTWGKLQSDEMWAWRYYGDNRKKKKKVGGAGVKWINTRDLGSSLKWG
jgi:hypothetical protein